MKEEAMLTAQKLRDIEERGYRSVGDNGGTEWDVFQMEEDIDSLLADRKALVEVLRELLSHSVKVTGGEYIRDNDDSRAVIAKIRALQEDR